MWWRQVAGLYDCRDRHRLETSRLRGRPASRAELTKLLVCLIAVLLVTTTGCMPRARLEPRLDGREKAALDKLNRKLVAAATVSPSSREYIVGPEDLLEVSLFDVEEREGEPQRIPTRVSQNGIISLPLIGQVEVSGRSALEIEDLLRERYRTFIHDPQITVFVKEYRSYRVSVVGYVEKPGLYEISGEKTLLEVLGLAGGLSDEAGTTVQLTRRTEEGLRTYYIDLDNVLREGDMRFNMPLSSGDVLSVPKAGVFYVEGSVKKPGSYPLREPITVTQAIATAGGPEERLASVGGTTLYRRGGDGGREAVPIDVDAIRSGRAEDPWVSENDVIVVPMSRAKYVAELLIGRVGIGISPGGF